VKLLGLSRSKRVKLKNEFSAVLAEGRKTATRDFILWSKSSPRGTAARRLGVIASRKNLGGAVDRNRAKRIVREIFRKNCGKLASGRDYIIYPRGGITANDYHCAEKALFELWRKAGVLLDETGQAPQ